MEKELEKEIEKRDYLQELKDILELNISSEEKKEMLLQYHESDIADILDELEDEKRKELIDILGLSFFGEVLTYSEDITEIANELNEEILADIIETMDADDAVDVLDELDEEKRSSLIELIEDDEVKEDILNIYKYDDDVIGSQISNNYITISVSDSIKSAMKKVIKEASNNDNVSTIFVLDEEEKLYGVIDLRDLIIARDGDDIKNIIRTNYPYFHDGELITDIVPLIKEYGLDIYPVLNNDKCLVGVITHDDALDVTYEEFEDDYAKLAGITEEEDISDGLFKSIKKRLPWLIVLLVLGLVQSFMMTGFEVVVASLPIIVFFQTLVLGMSGNTGTQSLAVTIRMLSDGDDGKGSIIKTLLKEIRIGFCNGLLLGTLAFGFVLVFLKITNQGVTSSVFDIFEALKASGIIGTSLMISMTVSSFVGAFVPILFKKIKIDPAVASGPFITTINDVTAMFIYYGLAAILFHIIL